MKVKIQKPKKLKLPLKKMSAKEKDYVAGLMENYNGNLAAIFEVLGDLRDKYDMHTEMIGSLMVDMTTVKSDIVEIKGDIVEIKGEIVEIKGELKVINGRLDRIEQSIKEMKNEITELKSVLKNKADVEKVELLESRLYGVEGQLKSHA